MTVLDFMAGEMVKHLPKKPKGYNFMDKKRHAGKINSIYNSKAGAMDPGNPGTAPKRSWSERSKSGLEWALGGGNLKTVFLKPEGENEEADKQKTELTAVMSCLWGPGLGAATFFAKFPNWIGDFSGAVENSGWTSYIEDILSLLADAIDTGLAFYNIDQECFQVDCEYDAKEAEKEMSDDIKESFFKGTPKAKSDETFAWAFLASWIGMWSGLLGYQGAWNACTQKQGGNGGPVDPVWFLLYDMWGLLFWKEDFDSMTESLTDMRKEFYSGEKGTPGGVNELDDNEMSALKWGYCEQASGINNGLFTAYEAMGTVIANWMNDASETDGTRGWEANCIAGLSKTVAKFNGMVGAWCAYKACNTEVYDKNAVDTLQAINRVKRSSISAAPLKEKKKVVAPAPPPPDAPAVAQVQAPPLPTLRCKEDNGFKPNERYGCRNSKCQAAEKDCIFLSKKKGEWVKRRNPLCFCTKDAAVKRDRKYSSQND